MRTTLDDLDTGNIKKTLFTFVLRIVECANFKYIHLRVDLLIHARAVHNALKSYIYFFKWTVWQLAPNVSDEDVFEVVIAIKEVFTMLSIDEQWTGSTCFTTIRSDCICPMLLMAA